MQCSSGKTWVGLKFSNNLCGYGFRLASLQKAQHSILLLGWTFDPRTRLTPDGDIGPSDPDEVGRVLLRLAESRPQLDIRLLIWKSALPIAAAQQDFPHAARRWFKGTRIKFRLDD